MESLKNYTSKVPVSKTLVLIEEELVSIGANRIVKEYESGKVASLAFVYKLGGNDIPFMLPVNHESTYKHLINGRKKITTSQQKQLASQAERTAWKNLYDWVRAQVVLIKLSQVDFMQVFLPFAYDYSTNTTLYDRIKGQDFKLLNN